MRYSSLADALFTRTRQRLLAALLLDPRESWYVAQLAGHLGVRRSTLQRDLSKLSAVGIIKMTRSGNRTYYRTDESCPVFPELRSLFLKTAGLVDVIRQELAPLTSKIRVACVYGSMADGTEASASDIDLLIIGTVKMIDLVPMLENVTRKLQREINPTIYTPGEFANKAQESRFIKSVLGRPLLFVIGQKHDLEGVAGRTPRRAGADRPRRN